MALLFHPYHSPADWALEDLLLSAPAPPPSCLSSCRSSMACAAPPSTYGLGRATANARHPTATAYSFRLAWQPSYAPPATPEVYISRSDEGVLARCPLGRAYSGDDLRLALHGDSFTITAFHPGTKNYWPERPVAYRHTLELAPHIDTQHIQARLDGGLLSIFFPYRRPEPRQATFRLVLVERPAPAPAPASAYCPVPTSMSVVGPALPLMARHGCPQRRTIHPPHQHQQGEQHPMCPGNATLSAFGCQQQQQAQHCSAAGHTRCQHPRTVPVKRAQPQRQPPVVPVNKPAEVQQEQEQPRAIPTEEESQPAQQEREEQQKETGHSRPATATASPAEAPPSAAATAVEEKGKTPASPEQVTALEKREAARRAAERIAAGSASDSDWEDADGTMVDCPLDS